MSIIKPCFCTLPYPNSFSLYRNPRKSIPTPLKDDGLQDCASWRVLLSSPLMLYRSRLSFVLNFMSNLRCSTVVPPNNLSAEIYEYLVDICLVKLALCRF